MKNQIPPNATILKQGSAKGLAIFFILAALVLAVFGMKGFPELHGGFLVGSGFMLLVGLPLLLTETSHALYIHNDTLYWFAHSGKKVDAGQARLDDIGKIILRRFYLYGRKSAKSVTRELRLELGDGEIILPANVWGKSEQSVIPMLLAELNNRGYQPEFERRNDE